MDINETKFLSGIERISSHISFVDKLIDIVVSMIAPKTFAKAGCWGNNTFLSNEKALPRCQTWCQYEGPGLGCRITEVYYELITFRRPDGTIGTCIDGCDWIVKTQASCQPCMA
jgi:hypothetical protein